MKFEILYETQVIKKDIPRLDSFIKDRIRKEIEMKLSIKPEVFGLPLQKSLKNYRKLRVGDYRIIFRIENHFVKIFAIQHRSIVYENMKSRK